MIHSGQPAKTSLTVLPVTFFSARVSSVSRSRSCAVLTPKESLVPRRPSPTPSPSLSPRRSNLSSSPSARTTVQRLSLPNNSLSSNDWQSSRKLRARRVLVQSTLRSNLFFIPSCLKFPCLSTNIHSCFS
jgi:hypothetical protein